MLAAMIIISALCIGIGIFPQTLYSILPYDVYYHPYTASHVLSQMELLCFALLAFAILKYNGVFPAETNTINLDTDWTYKKITPAIIRFIQKLCGAVYDEINKGTQVSLSFILNTIATLYRPQGKIAGMQSNSSMVLWIAILLSIALILSLLNVG